MTDPFPSLSRRAVSGTRMEGARIANAGNGALRIDRPVADVTMRDVTVTGGYRAFETLAARGLKDASVVGFTIENVRATGLQRGFARIGYNSHRGIIRDVQASGTVFNDDIPCGIAFMDTAHDCTIERCVMRGFRMEPGPDAYWNGDGYSSERGNYGLRFLRCAAWDCTDGGFDLKSTGTFLDGCIAGRNKYNYRFWSSLEAHELTSLNPVAGKGHGGHGHFSISADPPLTLHIDHLTARADDRAPLFTVHRGVATIVIRSHDLSLPRGTPLLAGAGKATIRWLSGAPKI